MTRTVLWSDFDGTAVEKFPKTHPKNWTKYPLAVREGYTDFLDGFTQAGGVVAGISSARPNMRAWATRRTVSKHAIANHLEQPLQIWHEGSEIGKAIRAIDSASDYPPALIDDLPHKVGFEALSLFSKMYHADSRMSVSSMVLGAVHSPYQAQSVAQLIQEAEQLKAEIEQTDDLISMSFGRHVLHLATLEPYSLEEGARLFEVTQATQYTGEN